MGVAIIVPGVSFADANLGKVNISGDVPIQALRIVAESSYVGTEVQLGVSYLPITTTQREVTWSIDSGSEYASITNDGKLTIKSGAQNSPVVVKVVSVSDSSIFATKEIRVTASGEPIPQDEPSAENNYNLPDGSTTVVDTAAPGAKRFRIYIPVNGVSVSGEITFPTYVQHICALKTAVGSTTSELLESSWNANAKLTLSGTKTGFAFLEISFNTLSMTYGEEQKVNIFKNLTISTNVLNYDKGYRV